MIYLSNKVKIIRQCHVEKEKAVYITGSIKELGLWNITKACRLNLTEFDNWICELAITTTESEFEFYYFTANYDNPEKDFFPLDKKQIYKYCAKYKSDLFEKVCKNKKEIKSMCFNIRFLNDKDGENCWLNRKELACTLFQTYICDFISLQEVLHEQLVDFQNANPFYSWYGRNMNEFVDVESCPIFYLHEKWEFENGNTIWLSNTPDIPGSKSYGNRIPRMLTWARFKNKETGIRFTVYNTHLDHKNENAQINGTVQIKDYINNNQLDSLNYLVCGDFNVTSNSKVLDLMLNYKSILVDTFLPNKNGNNGTIHGFNGSKKGKRIDYILIPKEKEVKSYKVIRDNHEKSYPSDHFPIISSFTI